MTLKKSQSSDPEADTLVLGLERYLPLVHESGGSIESAIALNRTIYAREGVAFNDRSGKFIQNPLESARTGRANCQGLSIMLGAAGRAVGIPSRVVAIPQWVGLGGGHSWVEFWIEGQWKHVSALDEFKEFDAAWFTARAAYTDPNRFQHRVYAASFVPTAINLEQYGRVSFVDITATYTARRPLLPPPAPD